jgi:hypothetical protein
VVLLALALALAPVAAGAEPPSAAVLVTQAAGAGDLPARLGLLAAEIVALHGGAVVRPDAAVHRLAPGLDPITCGTDEACLADAGRRLAVRWVVAVGVGRFGDLWGLDVRVLDAVQGGSARVASATYADPGPDWTAALREALERTLPEELLHPGTLLTVRTREPGASVLLDGAAIGTTPLEARPVAPGPHRVEARLPGHTAAQRDLTLAAGESAELELPLVPLGAGDRGTWPYVTGAATLGALTAAVLLHVTALQAAQDANTLHGTARIDRHGAAEDRMTVAAVLYGVAGAAALATGYLLLQ